MRLAEFEVKVAEALMRGPVEEIEAVRTKEEHPGVLIVTVAGQEFEVEVRRA